MVERDMMVITTVIVTHFWVHLCQKLVVAVVLVAGKTSVKKPEDKTISNSDE